MHYMGSVTVQPVGQDKSRKLIW